MIELLKRLVKLMRDAQYSDKDIAAFLRQAEHEVSQGKFWP